MREYLIYFKDGFETIFIDYVKFFECEISDPTLDFQIFLFDFIMGNAEFHDEELADKLEEFFPDSIQNAEAVMEICEAFYLVPVKEKQLSLFDQ